MRLSGSTSWLTITSAPQGQGREYGSTLSDRLEVLVWSSLNIGVWHLTTRSTRETGPGTFMLSLMLLIVCVNWLVNCQINKRNQCIYFYTGELSYFHVFYINQCIFTIGFTFGFYCSSSSTDSLVECAFKRHSLRLYKPQNCTPPKNNNSWGENTNIHLKVCVIW